jgi:hypothetical protein
MKFIEEFMAKEFNRRPGLRMAHCYTNDEQIALQDEVRRLQKIEAAAKLVVENSECSDDDYLTPIDAFEALKELLK